MNRRTFGSGSLPGSAAGGASQVGPPARAAPQSSVFDDEFAAGENVAGVAAHAKAFEHGIVHAHVVGLSADNVLGLGVPDDDVGVAAGSESSLLRIHPEDFGGSGGNDFDKSIQ